MDYRQTSGSATSWRRARAVMISNPRNATPSISFGEEDVVSVNGAETRSDVMGAAARGSLDPTAVIPLVNPDTGELTGETVTQAHLYQVMHSLYLQLAKQRDVASASPAPAP
jgi:hypothetical protein